MSKQERVWNRNVWAGAGVGAICGLGLLLLGFRLTRPSLPVPTQMPPAPPALALPLAGVTVILDPGHGGPDPGADHGPVSEAMLTVFSPPQAPLL